MDKDLLVRKALMVFVVAFSIIGLLFSIYLLIITPTLYTKFLAFSLFLLVTIAAFFNITGTFYFYKAYLVKDPPKIELKNFPKVAIVVAAYNESPDMLAETFQSLKKMDYPRDKLKFYLLDDSDKQDTVDRLKKYCKSSNIRFIHRTNREGFKGGALNNFLPKSNEEFIAIFDADEVLANNKFLKDTLGYFTDPKVAFVQTSKRYSLGSIFANTVDSTHAFFSNFVQPSRSSSGAPLFAGSCGIIRKSVLEELGGFDHCVVEDAAFSLKADVHGYGGVYLQKIYALGKPIENFTSFGSQQWRYNYGNTQLVSSYIANIKKFSLRRQIDYITLIFGLHYLSLVFILFAILSALIAFTEIPETQVMLLKVIIPVTIKFQIELLSLLSIVTTLLAAILMARIYFGSFRVGLIAYFLNFGVAFIRMKAAISAILTRFGNFLTVRRSDVPQLPWYTALKLTWIETLFSFFLFIAGFVSALNSQWASAFWMFWYSILFFSTFYFTKSYG